MASDAGLLPAECKVSYRRSKEPAWATPARGGSMEQRLLVIVDQRRDDLLKILRRGDDDSVDVMRDRRGLPVHDPDPATERRIRDIEHQLRTVGLAVVAP